MLKSGWWLAVGRSEKLAAWTYLYVATEIELHFIHRGRTEQERKLPGEPGAK